MKTYTFKELEAMHISKGKLAELIVISDMTFVLSIYHLMKGFTYEVSH